MLRLATLEPRHSAGYAGYTDVYRVLISSLLTYIRTSTEKQRQVSSSLTTAHTRTCALIISTLLQLNNRDRKAAQMPRSYEKIVRSLIVVLRLSSQSRKLCKSHVMASDLEHKLFAHLKADPSRPDSNLKPYDMSRRSRFLGCVCVERPMRLPFCLIDVPVTSSQYTLRA